MDFYKYVVEFIISIPIIENIYSKHTKLIIDKRFFCFMFQLLAITGIIVMLTTRVEFRTIVLDFLPSWIGIYHINMITLKY